MSDDQDQPRGSGDAGTERALDELRVALEQLAGRMGAGFREDLAQIRAIATSVAERDLTSDLEALRVDVGTLVGRDVSAEVRDELASVRAELARLASGDDLAGVRAELAPLQASLDRVSSRLDDDTGRTQVLARFEALEARLDQLAGADGSAEILARLDALAGRLEAMPSSQQVGNLAGDLRAHLADALGGLDGDALMRELAGLRGQLGHGHGTVVEQLQDILVDVASGEVVGALWDEVRQLRADLPDLVGVPEPVAAPDREPDPQLAALTEELVVLRAELNEGLVVEPSDALSGSLDALRAEVDGLRGALGELRSAPEPVATEPVDDRRDEQLLEQLDAIRAGIDEVRARLDEGLVLAEDDQVPAATDAADGPGIDAVVDQVAALRDFVASELETVQQAMAARLDAVSEATAATVAAATARPEPAPEPEPEPTPPAEVHATVDPETVDLLRAEIRAAGAIGDQVIDALRDELRALRRRIAVKASERVLDDQQLAQIADAVAGRLAEDGKQP